MTVGFPYLLCDPFANTILICGVLKDLVRNVAVVHKSKDMVRGQKKF